MYKRYLYERLEREPSIASRPRLYREIDRAPSKSQQIRSYDPSVGHKLSSDTERGRTLPTQELVAPARSNRGRSAAVKPSTGDRRLYHPQGMNRPAVTVYGSPAVLVGSRAKGQFSQIPKALPCVERVRRREVLFAKGKGGKGYRSPHRKNPYSDIWC